MSKKAAVPLRIAPLQHVIAEPITDPAEQAALDKVRKRQKRKQARTGANAASGSAARRRGNVEKP